MVSRVLLIAAIAAVLVTAAIAADKTYYSYPDATTLPADGRILMYDPATGSKNITGATLTSEITSGAACTTIFDGTTGSPGPRGPAGGLTIGTVITGLANTPSSVTNVGSFSEAILNFVLQKGDTGASGAGVPSGGNTYDYLRKASITPFDTVWANFNTDVLIAGAGIFELYNLNIQAHIGT